MYSLSSVIDVSVFNEKELEMICFTANTISLSFTKNVAITIMGSYILENNVAEKSKQSVPVSSSSLMCLIRRVIQSAERGSDGSLKLHFDNKHNLIILDDSKIYESYHVRIGSKEIIV